MKLLVLCCMVTAFLLLIILLAPLGYKLDSKWRRFSTVMPHKNNFMEETLHQPLSQRFLKPLANRLLSFLHIFGSKNDKKNEKLERQVKSAGLSIGAKEFEMIKRVIQAIVFIAALLFAVLLSVPILQKLLVLICGVLVAVLVPDYYIKSRITARQASIRKNLPDIMDLLVVSVEAGLGFDSAIMRLYEHNRTPVMQELYQAVHDVQLGVHRRTALKEMADRCNVQEMKIFASSMIQAEQLGISIKSVLISQADQLRIARKQKTEAKAMKAPVKMMIPTVVFIFPVMFIILLAPAVLRFMNAF